MPHSFTWLYLKLNYKPVPTCMCSSMYFQNKQSHSHCDAIRKIFLTGTLRQLALFSQGQGSCQIEQASGCHHEGNGRLSTHREWETFLAGVEKVIYFLESNSLGKPPGYCQYIEQGIRPACCSFVWVAQLQGHSDMEEFPLKQSYFLDTLHSAAGIRGCKMKAASGKDRVPFHSVI